MQLKCCFFDLFPYIGPESRPYSIDLGAFVYNVTTKGAKVVKDLVFHLSKEKYDCLIIDKEGGCQKLFNMSHKSLTQD